MELLYCIIFLFLLLFFFFFSIQDAERNVIRQNCSLLCFSLSLSSFHTRSSCVVYIVAENENRDVTLFQWWCLVVLFFFFFSLQFSSNRIRHIWHVYMLQLGILLCVFFTVSYTVVVVVVIVCLSKGK